MVAGPFPPRTLTPGNRIRSTRGDLSRCNGPPGRAPYQHASNESDVASGEEGARPVATRGERGPRGRGVGACRAEIAEIATAGEAVDVRSDGRVRRVP